MADRYLVKGAVVALLIVAAQSSVAAVHVVNCAGTGFTTINDAVAAAADGDTIVVEDCGAAYGGDISIENFNGLHIVAASQGDVGARAAGVGAASLNPPVTIDGGGAESCFVIGNSVDIKIQNFRISQCEVGIRVLGASRIYLLANRIVDHTRNAIDSIVTDDVSIIGNYVLSTGSDAIVMSDSGYGIIADNLIKRAGADGIRFEGGFFNRVDNNVLRRSAGVGLRDTGLETRIERNTFAASAGGFDIVLTGDDADVVGNDISSAISDSGTGTELQNNF